VTRQGHELPIAPKLRVHRGDILFMIGARKDVETLVAAVGFPERRTQITDLVTVGIGIIVTVPWSAFWPSMSGASLSPSASAGAFWCQGSSSGGFGRLDPPGARSPPRPKRGFQKPGCGHRIHGPLCHRKRPPHRLGGTDREHGIMRWGARCR
jgi:hypothetical protein